MIVVYNFSKPFSYALALTDLSHDEVHKFVGMEPSGRSFSELTLDRNSEYRNRTGNAKFGPGVSSFSFKALCNKVRI